MHLSTTDTVKDMECQAFALISFSFLTRDMRKDCSHCSCVFKTYMSCNAFDVWISLYKSFENFFSC